MTIAVEESRVVYTGNGATTNWAFPFPVYDADDLQVFLYEIATGTVGAELNPVLYTVNEVGEDDGSIDYPLVGSPLASTHKIILQRRVEMLQPLNFNTARGFDPAALTEQLDLMTMMIQQNADEVERAVKVDISGADDPDDFLTDIEAAVTAAELAATNAGTAETNAETAETNAETAQGLAEAARDTAVAAAATVSGPTFFQGVWDASAGTFPGTVGRKKGWSYIVSVAGTVGGQAFELNDELIALVDNASTTVYAANWYRLEKDLVQSVAGLAGAIAAADLRTVLAILPSIDEDSFVSNSASHVPTQQSTKAYADAKYVATRTALKAIDTTVHTVAHLTEAGREGTFIWTTGNFSSQITADTAEGLYVKANAIASTSGAWVRQREDLTCNVLWFGASPAATKAANATAVMAALAMLTSFGTLFIPAGNYALSSATITKTLAANQVITIKGEGNGVTTLYFPDNGDGMVFTYTAPASTFAWLDGCNMVVEDVTFTTGVANTGRALSINGVSTPGNPNRPTVLNRVGFAGTTAAGSYWATGLYAVDVQTLLVNDSSYFSYVLAVVGTAIHYHGTSDAGTKPTICNVHNFTMQFGERGVYATGYIEGVNVVQSNFTQVAYCVVFQSTNDRPMCSVTGSQMWASVVGILTNAHASQITGNLIFLSAGAYGVLGVPVYTPITGNTFIGLGALAAAVVLQSGAVQNLIDGNVIKGMGTNIWLQAGANNNTLGINVHVDGTPLLDQAIGNTSGVIPHMQLAMQAADRAGSDVNTAQAVFAAAQDTITLVANKTYEFEAEYYIERSAGTTSHTTGVLFGGTVTVSSIRYNAMISNPTGNVLGAVSEIVGAALTEVVLTAANTSATENLRIRLKGKLRTSAAGTLIPQFKYSAAPGGAPTIKANTSFKIWMVGTDTAVAVGAVA